VITGQSEDAERAAREVLDAGMDPILILEKELFPIMKIVGDKFEKGEYFLTDLMSAADAMRAASHTLTSKIKAEGKQEKLAKIGKLVIGTVSGDIHDIGKNIVSLLLEVNGFDIDDLGKDVQSMRFVERAQELQTDIVAVSALMTTTRPAQKEVMELLDEMRIRDRYAVIVGGAPTSKEWADQIGADGWAETADQAVTVAKRLLEER
jgi:corrinoid protein of di/trimethylamine methyltransferase